MINLSKKQLLFNTKINKTNFEDLFGKYGNSIDKIINFLESNNSKKIKKLFFNPSILKKNNEKK